MFCLFFLSLSQKFTLIFVLSFQYKYQTQAKKDIANVLGFYRGLQPKLEKYTFSDGKEQDLVLLHGTIPISFKGSTYHIPVGIFVQKDHPYSPPMCYVRPTSEMAIKISKYVDHEGKIYLPYLSDWKADSSDILGAIQVMIIIFGETPPVYQKPKTSPMEPQQPYVKPPYPTQSNNLLSLELYQHPVLSTTLTKTLNALSIQYSKVIHIQVIEKEFFSS